MHAELQSASTAAPTDWRAAVSAPFQNFWGHTLRWKVTMRRWKHFRMKKYGEGGPLTFNSLLHFERVGVIRNTSVSTLQLFGVPLKRRLTHQFLHCIAALVPSKKLWLANAWPITDVVTHVLGRRSWVVEMANTHETKAMNEQLRFVEATRQLNDWIQTRRNF